MRIDNCLHPVRHARRAPPTGLDRDDRADSVAVGLGPFKQEADGMAACGLVVEIAQWASSAGRSRHRAAVVIKVADGEPAGNARQGPGLASRLSDVGQVAVLAAHHELSRHLHRDSRGGRR